MAYYIDLFSPETYRAFTQSDQSVSGFRERQRSIAARVKPGDKLVCYVTKLSRWVGILEVTSEYFIDSSSIFTEADDPFIVRFRVKVCSWLALENAVPVTHELSWPHLSFTRTLSPGSTAWTGMVRGSLRKVEEKDGRYLEQLLASQAQSPILLHFEGVVNEPSTAIVKTQASKEITVAIPDNEETVEVV